MADKETKKGSIFGRKDPQPQDQVIADPEQDALRKKLDQGLKDTFPASDPPAVSQPTKAGRRGARK